jgi:outer membrane biosynthesis protein TonB
MNANEKASTADGRRLRQMSSADEPAAPRRQLSYIEIRSIRVHSRPFVVAMILLSAGMLAQPASAGPFEALKNFFVRPQPQAHVTHHRPAHPKEAPKDAPKDAPNDSPSPVAPPVDQQTNQQPNGAPQQQNTGPQNTGQQNTLNNNSRPGRPALAAAPLF